MACVAQAWVALKLRRFFVICHAGHEKGTAHDDPTHFSLLVEPFWKIFLGTSAANARKLAHLNTVLLPVTLVEAPTEHSASLYPPIHQGSLDYAAAASDASV